MLLQHEQNYNNRSLTTIFDRNGSVKQIKDIVHHLNDAKVDSNTGPSKSSTILALPPSSL